MPTLLGEDNVRLQQFTAPLKLPAFHPSGLRHFRHRIGLQALQEHGDHGDGVRSSQKGQKCLFTKFKWLHGLSNVEVAHSKNDRC